METRQRGRIVSVLLTLCAGFLLFACAERLLFRPGAYTRLLEPRSYAGQFQLLAERELRASEAAAPRRVLVLGDSKVAEGFSESKAQELTGDRWNLVNGALLGSTPRVWYYLLREVDPARSRYRIILVPLTDYPDIDSVEDLSNRTLDLRTILPWLRLSDIPLVASSFNRWSDRWHAVRSIILKGHVLQHDIQEFLVEPGERLNRVEQFRANWSQWRFQYAGNDRSLEGLEYDPGTGVWTYPPAVDPLERTLLSRLLEEPPQIGQTYRYRKFWLTRIVDCYAATKTKIVFLRLPRGPVVAPFRRRTMSGSVVSQLVRRPNVEALPESLFDSLERPEYFFDSLHMNRVGRDRFTQILTGAILGILDSGQSSGRLSHRKKGEI